MAVLVVELLAGMQVYLNQTVLPLLIAARAVMAGRIGDLNLDEGEEDEEVVPWLPSLAMAAGVAIIGALRASSPWFWPGVAGGTTLVLWSCSRVLPAGTLCLAVGRRAGIATLMWVCAFFLTLDYLVAPSAHDVVDMTPTQIGWALTAGGIGWSVVALVCGAHPAREPKAYRRRTTLAAAFVAPTASGVETDRLWPTLILLVVGLLLTPLLARRAA